jgi:hypothetical protein
MPKQVFKCDCGCTIARSEAVMSVWCSCGKVLKVAATKNVKAVVAK